MAEWKTLADAPIGVPVKVWCNILSDDEREWTAVQRFRGWWTLHGKHGRIHPTHWMPLPPPPTPKDAK